MINTRAIASEYRLIEWSKVMKDRAESGQSIKVYCERNGIQENAYFYWQKKLREAACTKIQSGEQIQTKPVPTGWAMLSAETKLAETQEITIEINGCRITINNDTDTELLTKACRALKAI
jgi:putative transposase